jgi:hypothetical protein
VTATDYHLLTVEQMIRFPIASEEVDRFKVLIGNTKPAKPYAFIFGHGLWNVRLKKLSFLQALLLTPRLL